MKTIVTILITFFSVIVYGRAISTEWIPQVQSTVSVDTLLSDKFLNSLIHVESRGNRYKIGKAGERGVLQIRQCVLDDVYRFYKIRYTLKDTLDNNKSKMICRLYLKHWAFMYRVQTGHEITHEILARIWNGGPKGYKLYKTNAYWIRVKRVL